MPANDIVKFRDLPDFRNLLQSGDVISVGSPLTITGTAPALVFDDTNNENFRLSADSDILSIINDTGPITFVRFRGGANDDIQVDRPIVFNSTITLPEDITLSGASPSITLTDTGGDDFSLTVDADVATFAFGGLTHFRLRGAANDDIQFDRPVTFNSTVSGLTFTDITLSDTSPTITFTDTNADDFQISVDGSTMTLSDTTTGDGVILNSRGVFRFIPKVTVNDGTSVGNVGSGLDSLNSFTLNIGDLVTAGDYCKVRIAGSFGVNDNDKRIQITLDSQVIDNQSLFDQDSGNWCYDITLIRLSATSVRFNFMAVWGIISADGASAVAGNGKVFAGTGSVTVANMDSNNIVFLVQAEGTSNNDIQQTWLDAHIVQIT